MNSSYVLINDLRYHYYEWNLGDGEPVVLLLHGLASNGRIWELVAPHLADAGLVAIAPDLRGHGLTDRPDGDYGFDTFTRDLAAFMDACNLEKPVLIGHSWGANLALDYAARYRSGPRAPRAIGMVDGGLTQLDDFPDATWEKVSQRLAPPRLAGMPLEELLSIFSSPNRGWQPDDRAISIMLANFEVSEDERVYPRLSFEHHMQIVRAMWEQKVYEIYRKVSCPVLVIPASPPAPPGAREQEFLEAKRHGADLARQTMKNVRVQWMDDSIHDIPLQRPEELALLIVDFIRSLNGG